MSITTPPAQPTEGQDPQQVTPPAQISDGPWANDIRATFTDPAQAAQVDAFLRSRVQPYTTKLEQSAAESKDAIKLWGDLSENPVDTYVAITQEMYGPEAAQAVLTALQGQQQEATPPVTEQQPAPQIDPRMNEAIEYFENQKNQAYYDSEIARVQNEHPEVNPDLFHPFVAAAGGDFDQAFNIYSSFIQNWTAVHTPVGEEQPVPVPPTVIGSDVSTGLTPPVEPQKQTLASAIDDFMSENRANKEAPPIA